MKLSDIESRKLLPRFASKIAWLMDALDSIIKPISERLKSIDAPLTLEAIAALTDEELETLYNQYGVAQYYPDLSRSTRDLMLYEMCKIYRYLGTPHAIELLCNYIFDNVPLNVHVLDNLAFDDQGTLIDATLLDVFDIEVNPELPVLSEDATARLIANIIRFGRNSQALRDIIYTFTENFELSVYPLRAGVPVIFVENDAICEPVTPPTPAYTEITLYLQSGDKWSQMNVNSTFVGDVDSAYCYQLYTDAGCTIPWTGYDYSNDYEVGRYVDGEWDRRVDSISSMPASDTPFTFARILMDTGRIWFCCNDIGSAASTSETSIVVRIYPKGQQVFALYTNSSSVYGNTTINFNSFSGLFLKPGLSGAIYPGNWPSKSLIKVLGSACNVVSERYNDFNFATANGMLRLGNFYGSAVAKSVRCALLTFSEPVYYAELGRETYLFSGANRSSCRLYEKYPEALNFEAGYSYKVITPIALNGSATGGAQSVIDAIYFEPYSSTDQQAIIRTTSSGAFYLKAVWYTKTPSAIISKAGNFGEYNWTYPPDQNTVLQPGESCILDDSGTPGTTYAYDSTKSYGVLQWQTESGTRAGATELQIVGIEQGGQTIIGCKNVSSASVTVSYVRVCVCSSSSATVVSVYNSSNVAYNAFKLSLSGTDYYYVLDNTQTTWVADLSSIGYSLSLRKNIRRQNMAFGGYKFKGYKVVRANLATNTYANWCLLVHQARIKAFMECQADIKRRVLE